MNKNILLWKEKLLNHCTGEFTGIQQGRGGIQPQEIKKKGEKSSAQYLILGGVANFLISPSAHHCFEQSLFINN